MADDPDILTYVRRASGKLLELLTGQVSPLEVLFERGSLDQAAGIYERSPSARYMNVMVAAAVRSALEDHRDRSPFRLVEVGAGTGGTTTCIAEFFPQGGEYWFTDLSDAFLTRARRKFGQNSAFRFTKFDLDAPPPKELPVGHADVVVAANVVHATRDVGVTLDGLRSLLKPGGLLILLESTTYLSHYDLTIGFVEGWSSFADDYRTHHPLLTVDRWISLLRERGFAEAERFPRDESAADSIGQHVIIARSNSAPRQDARLNLVTSTVTATSDTLALAPAQRSPKFSGAITAARRQEVQDFVRMCAAQVMHLDPASQPGSRERFTELGMDSLMALQFQSLLADGFGLREQIPTTIALHTGTVEALTDQILQLTEDLSTERGSSTNFTAGSGALTSSVLKVDDLERISDEEVAVLLDKHSHTFSGPTDR